jgi:hypothetical protein
MPTIAINKGKSDKGNITVKKNMKDYSKGGSGVYDV